MASIQKRPDGMYRARYRGPDGKEYTRHFKYKNRSNVEPHLGSAQQWLDEQTAALHAGTWVDPSKSKMTVGAWLTRWLAGYASKRPGTVLSAKTHARLIEAKFGSRQLQSIRPSDVKAWMSELSESYATSYVYAIHRRLHQVLEDAAHDGLLVRNPVSRKTSPPAPKQRPYVATTEQIWALYDALPVEYRNMLLLGAFAGLRVGEMAALERSDVDWDAPSITVSRQYGKEYVKSDASHATIPIPAELAEMLDADAGAVAIVPGVFGRGVSGYQLNRVWIAARESIAGLPPGFRIQDMRHYFASMLIAAGLDVKVVQARMRHASATITLNTYGHLWPDTDDTSRNAVGVVLRARKSPPGVDPEGSPSDSAD